MCYNTRTHVHCGHAEKLPIDPSLCICTLNNKTQITYAADGTKTGTDGSQKKNHSKLYGDFQGEVKPVKESWCPKCLVEKKANIFDKFTAGNLGSVLSNAVNPGEPQIHPVKTHTKMPKTTEEKDEKEGAAVYEGAYKVPKWGMKWGNKTRQEMKSEIREGKMEMVDQIRVLRGIVQANGMTTTELEQRIQAQTDERRSMEQKKSDDVQKERQEKIAEMEVAINAKRVEKAKEKADRIRDHLQREAARKARVLYRV